MISLRRKIHMAACYVGENLPHGNYSDDTPICNERAGWLLKLKLCKDHKKVTCPDCNYMLRAAGLSVRTAEGNPFGFLDYCYTIPEMRNLKLKLYHQIAAEHNALAKVKEFLPSTIKIMQVRADSGEDITKCFECGAESPLFRTLDHIGPCMSKEAQALLDELALDHHQDAEVPRTAKEYKCTTCKEMFRSICDTCLDDEYDAQYPGERARTRLIEQPMLEFEKHNDGKPDYLWVNLGGHIFIRNTLADAQDRIADEAAKSLGMKATFKKRPLTPELRQVESPYGSHRHQ